MNCPVCHSTKNEAIYKSKSAHSISSLAEQINGMTEVFLCRDCTHVFTRPLENLDDYYDQQYNILTGAEEEDQLFVTKDGKGFYRLEYQADIVERKLSLKIGDKVLDYGCAKASTLKLLQKRNPGITPMCFDISNAYQKFWDSFIAPEHCFANIHVPAKWNNSISFITSFFSLEHAENPIAFIRDVHRLLKDGGRFLIIVPDFETNWADLIVADHVNHFTAHSIHRLLENNGFSVLDLDREIYHGALVLTAEKKVSASQCKHMQSGAENIIKKVREVASFWSEFSDKISKIERNLAKDRFAIYGSGFYGAYISTLMHKEPQCFLDQSPHRQGREFLGRPIIDPKSLPSDIEHMIVGLNPTIAKKVIESNKDLNLKNVKVHYIN